MNKLPQIVLNAEEQAHYGRIVGRVLYRAVQEYASFSGNLDRNVWTPVCRNNHMVIYRSLKGLGDPRVTLMLGVGKINGSLEDVMDAENTADLRTVMTLLKCKYVGGSIMHVAAL